MTKLNENAKMADMGAIVNPFVAKLPMDSVDRAELANIICAYLRGDKSFVKQVFVHVTPDSFKAKPPVELTMPKVVHGIKEHGVQSFRKYTFNFGGFEIDYLSGFKVVMIKMGGFSQRINSVDDLMDHIGKDNKDSFMALLGITQ